MRDYALILKVGYLGLVAIAGTAVIIWMTPYGAGVSLDSTVYLAAARNLLAGRGFVVRDAALTHFPPLYPMLLAITGMIEIDLVQGARALNALLFGITLALVGIAAFLATNRDPLAAAAAPLVVLLSAPLLALHSWAWSEPLFIAFSLAGIILLSLYVSKRDLRFLIGASIALGLACLARYIGIALLPALMIVVLMGHVVPDRRQRIREALILAAFACAPLALFLIHNALSAGAPTDRQLVFHPFSAGLIRQFESTLYTFFVPTLMPNWLDPVILALVLALLCGALFLVMKHYFRNGSWGSLGDVITFCCLLMSASYILFLLVSITLLDSATPMDFRIVSPLFVWLVVSCFGAVWSLSGTFKEPAALRRSFVLLAVLAVVVRAPQTVESVLGIRSSGQGYTSRKWQGSPTIAFVRLLPKNADLYSNGPEALTFLTMRASHGIPRKMGLSTSEPNNQYDAEVESMCTDVKANGAIVVYFRAFSGRQSLPSPQELKAKCRLPILRRFPDGIVYGTR